MKKKKSSLKEKKCKDNVYLSESSRKKKMSIFGSLLFFLLFFCTFIINIKCQSLREPLPLPFIQAYNNHTLLCPLKHNDLVFCNFHNKKETCICNYGSSSNILPDKTWLCEIPNGERKMGNYITKVVINRKGQFENDQTFQRKFLTVLEKYVLIPSENVVFLLMKCIANDPNLIELYFIVKLFNHPQDKFYLFKDNYYEDFSAIHKQTELNIVAIKLEKNQIFDKTIPDIISPTLQPKSIDFNEYGIYIFTFIFLSLIILFIGCWASKDLSKWYALKENEKQNDLEMFTFDSTTSTSTLQP